MKKSTSFSARLRGAVDSAAVSRYRIAKDTGISEANLSRFARGQAGLSLDNLDLLCKYLGLRLIGPENSKRK